VVGETGCPYTPFDRNLVRKNLQDQGLDRLLRHENAFLADLRGPSSPDAAVIETVRLLRHADWKPADIAVHGCLLDPRTGGLRIVDRDRSARQVPPAIEATARLPEPADIPLPELPEIALPEIPAFDPDSLEQPQPETTAKNTTTRKVSYGQRAGSGPVAFSDMQAMPEVASLANGINSKYAASVEVTGTGFESPEIEVEVPAAGRIQDTGLSAAPDVVARRDVRAREDTPTPVPQLGTSYRQRASHARNARRPRPQEMPIEQPSVTPIAHAPPQPPLGERVMELEPEPPAGRNRRELQVDIQRGYVTHRGNEFPIDPELQRALLKIQRFVGSELSSEQRRNIIGQVQRGKAGGQPFGELLKMMISPVLKLGKKRYAVINELLKVKEDLPRQDPDVSTAILVSVLKGR